MNRERYQRPTVFKKGRRTKLWAAEWHVYAKHPDGSEYRKHVAGTFGECSKTTKAEAQKACDARVARETGQAPLPDGSTTVGEFWSAIFYPVRSRKWAYNTRQAMESTWRLHIEPTFGSQPLRDVNKHAIEKHLIVMADAKLSRQLVDRVRVLLHSVFDEALENGYVDKNPARKVDTPECKAEETTRALTEAEVQRLFASITGRERLMFRILVLCGPRIGELLALRRDDFLGSVLRVDESALSRQRSNTKNRKKRPLPLSPRLQTEIRHWLDAYVIDPAPDALMFPATGARMMDRCTEAREILERVRAASGIADLDYQMTRRTFATLYQGDVKDAQEILGHGSAEVTMEHYKKAIPERQLQAAAEMDARLTAKPEKPSEARKQSRQ